MVPSLAGVKEPFSAKRFKKSDIFTIPAGEERKGRQQAERSGARGNRRTGNFTRLVTGYQTGAGGNATQEIRLERDLGGDGDLELIVFRVAGIANGLFWLWFIAEKLHL